MTVSMPVAIKKAKFGIAGLDDITAGGLSEGHLFLLEGTPGTGNTTVALQFLLEGEKNGETGLYITLSETENELRLGAASHGWSLGPLIKVSSSSQQKRCSGLQPFGREVKLQSTASIESNTSKGCS